jgi:hypothetical protein
MDFALKERKIGHHHLPERSKYTRVAPKTTQFRTILSGGFSAQATATCFLVSCRKKASEGPLS